MCMQEVSSVFFLSLLSYISHRWYHCHLSLAAILNTARSDPSMPVFLNINPSLCESHSRRREPGHIPHPRNAFIIFRSSYIHGCTSTGEGQQNELSKQAGNLWNGMTEKEKVPFAQRAAAEKLQH